MKIRITLYLVLNIMIEIISEGDNYGNLFQKLSISPDLETLIIRNWIGGNKLSDLVILFPSTLKMICIESSNIHNYYFPKKLTKIMHQLPYLTHLEFRNCPLGNIGCREIIDYLNDNAMVKINKLIFDNVGMDSEILPHLASLTRNTKCPKSIEISKMYYFEDSISLRLLTTILSSANLENICLDHSIVDLHSETFKIFWDKIHPDNKIKIEKGNLFRSINY